MPLTEQDKERCRYHMGYLGVAAAPSISFGIPRLSQTMYLLEQSMSNLIELVVPRVRSIMDVMDGLERQLVEAQERLAATKLEELSLNKSETSQLEGEYQRWGLRLADVMGAPVNPFSARYSSLAGGSGQAGSIPLRRPM